jgi:hypothetical protein
VNLPTASREQKLRRRALPNKRFRQEILWLPIQLLSVADVKINREQGRFDTGPNGGETVPHLPVHIPGGRGPLA